jgi:hypothetical protein
MRGSSQAEFPRHLRRTDRSADLREKPVRLSKLALRDRLVGWTDGAKGRADLDSLN